MAELTSMKIKNKMSNEEYKKSLGKQRTLSDLFRSEMFLLAADIYRESVEEFQFHSTRKWRFDFAWPKNKVAVECDGMAWQAGGGRHNTDKDREKLNTAVSMGWRVLRFSGLQIRTDPVGCLQILEKTLKGDLGQ